MSVSVHEAFSLDSFMDRLLFWDDFEGDQVKDEWSTATTGSIVVVDAQTGGVVRSTTGAVTNNASTLTWNNIRSLHIDQKVTMEARVKLAVADATMYSYIALYFDGSNHVMFYHRSADANIQIQCSNGGAVSRADSGIAKDTDWHIYRIECFPTGEVHFYIDGTETTNSPITTNIPDDAADFLQPYFRLVTNEDVAKTMDIDYCYIRQERT